MSGTGNLLPGERRRRNVQPQVKIKHHNGEICAQIPPELIRSATRIRAAGTIPDGNAGGFRPWATLPNSFFQSSVTAWPVWTLGSSSWPRKPRKPGSARRPWIFRTSRDSGILRGATSVEPTISHMAWPEAFWQWEWGAGRASQLSD